MTRVEAGQRSRNVLGMALQLAALVLLLAILATVIVGLFALVSVVNAPREVATGVTAQAGQALSSAQQAIQNATDPNHPPSGLNYDTELTALDVWHVGDGLPGGTNYVVTIQSIQRRPGAPSSDTGEYAVMHAELRQPRVTRILGQVVRSDSDPHDFVVYKGEMFRLSGVMYRVNWISQQAGEVAAGVVRDPDTMTQSLKFDYT
jgi:type II secretory pathway pseudopilin PulG